MKKQFFKACVLLLSLTILTSCKIRISDAGQKNIMNNHKSLIVFKPKINLGMGPMYPKYDEIILYWRNSSLISAVPFNNSMQIVGGGSSVKLDDTFLKYESNEYITNDDLSIAMVVSPGTYTLGLIRLLSNHDPKFVRSGIAADIKPKEVTTVSMGQYGNYAYYNKSTEIKPEISLRSYRVYENQKDYTYITVPPGYVQFTIHPGEVIYLGEINLYHDFADILSYSITNGFNSVLENAPENYPLIIDRLRIYGGHHYNILTKINNIKIKQFTKTETETR